MNRRSLFRRLLLAPAVAVLGPLLVPAKRARRTYLWCGGRGDWDNPDNWNPRGVPGLGNDVFVLGGIANIRKSASCHSLTVGAATVRGEGECHIGHLVVRDEPGTCYFWRHS